ncbi:hypothetical protein EFN70_07240 [Pediococcus ethanolidurans]|nr:hypothetical protein [Pediococcus ethanolidurans]
MYAGSQSRGSCACGSLFDLSSGPRAQWKKANKRMEAGSYPAGVVLVVLFLTCRAVLGLSGKKHTRGCMRDRNPTEVVLRVLFLFYQAVLREI